jgi:hypothetical protein
VPLPPKPNLAKKAFPLRIDQPLYDAVERLAAADLRSVNAELEVLLREALGRRGIRVAVGERAPRGRPPKGGAPKRGETQ